VDTFVKAVALNERPTGGRRAHRAIQILVLEAAPYTKALLFLDVGAAYSISSLSLISVTFMSQCLLRERVTKTRWIGVCLIFIGVGLVVART